MELGLVELGRCEWFRRVGGVFVVVVDKVPLHISNSPLTVRYNTKRAQYEFGVFLPASHKPTFLRILSSNLELVLVLLFLLRAYPNMYTYPAPLGPRFISPLFDSLYSVVVIGCLKHGSGMGAWEVGFGI